MPEKLKIEKSLDKTRDKAPETEIDPEIERRLKTIAQRVGGDFGMKVEIIPAGKRPQGEPELGSYFDSQETKIIFDPEHVTRDPEEAEFIAGHEGGHRAISRGPESIGLKKEKIQEIYNQVGFAFTFNALEDPADNNWIKEKFPGLEPNIKKTYDKMLEVSEKQDIPLGLSHPEALQSTRLLGYVPKFVHYGSEIIRYWHKGEFSKKLDPEVKKALDKTKNEAEEYFKTIPGSKPTEEEIIEKAKERFLIDYEKIWPEVKKLVEEDLNNEKLRQMLIQGLGKDKLPKDLQKELKEKLEGGQKEGEAMPIPMDELSEGLKKKLKEVFDSLPEKQKKELKEKAEKQLRELEDKLNEDLKGKLNQDNPESHQERTVRIRKEQEGKEKEKQEKEEIERARKEFEKKLEAEMSEYDKAYKEVKPLIDDLYRQLLKIFIPERHPRWKSGYPSGSRIDLDKAMQYEAERSKYTELWERKSIPRKIDYRFSLLIDLSGSMSGETIQQTFRGLVVLAETLSRLDLKYEIIGFTTIFSNNVKLYKEFKEKLSKEARDRVGSMKSVTGGNTPTSSATRFASERLEENKGKHNFLITLTDGMPTDNPEATKEFIKQTRKTTNQKFIGLGLGPGTGHVKEFYPNSIANISVKELPKKLARLFEEIIKHPGKY